MRRDFYEKHNKKRPFHGDAAGTVPIVQLVITALFTQFRYLGISCYALAALIVILMIKPCLSKETYVRRDSVKRGVIIFVAIIVPDVIRQFILWETLPKPIEPILTMLLTFYGVLLGASYEPIKKEDLLAEASEEDV